VNGDVALTVAVLAGGRSSEHDVSLASGRAVVDGLAQGGHATRWIGLGRDGTWRYEGAEIAVSPGRGLLDSDVAFPALHGPFGEDGTVQGMLEILDVPYVGAGVTAAAVCMDKVLFKQLMAPAGVPQVDFAAVREEQWRAERAVVLASLAALGLPVFVKPARLGSSVGIERVAAAAELADALDAAFVHDRLAIVEATAAGIEVECSVLGCRRAERTAGGPPAIASRPGEIVIEREFYDYEAKYAPGGMQLIVPARVSDSATERVRELAVEVFLRSGCDGLARVDFFVDGEHVVVNELNTMPGFTTTSVYAKLWGESGVSYPQLLDRLCRLAIERHQAERTYRY
jgi:D-alanine-D-alanine ligase